MYPYHIKGSDVKTFKDDLSRFWEPRLTIRPNLDAVLGVQSRVGLWLTPDPAVS
jgi:hypothetical protein